MRLKKYLIVLLVFVVIIHLNTIPVNAGIPSDKHLDSVFNAIDQKLDSVKVENTLIRKNLQELTHTYEGMEQTDRSGYLNKLGLIFIIFILGLSIMFICGFILFKKFVNHKYNVIDF